MLLFPVTKTKSLTTCCYVPVTKTKSLTTCCYVPVTKTKSLTTCCYVLVTKTKSLTTCCYVLVTKTKSLTTCCYVPLTKLNPLPHVAMSSSSPLLQSLTPLHFNWFEMHSRPALSHMNTSGPVQSSGLTTEFRCTSIGSEKRYITCT